MSWVWCCVPAVPGVDMRWEERAQELKAAVGYDHCAPVLVTERDTVSKTNNK